MRCCASAARGAGCCASTDLFVGTACCAPSWASPAPASTTGAGRRGPRGRQAGDARLTARIRAVHRESDGTYGVPRITAELRGDGERVDHKRIARVMPSINLAGVLRRRHRTTITDPAAAKAPDLIGRDFTASEPNTKYAGDITYLPVNSGKFLYLATVIDLASRRLAG
ncbi:IS3 family transposase [Streptomyces sp. NPDC047841]|uniref:IS3 family transposase n=1 Tax=Streptomyces sp. NPDC047841 TaxID=3154708 RepID=UPI0034537655